MDGIFFKKHPWTGRLLWQLSRLLQNILTTLCHVSVKKLTGECMFLRKQDYWELMVGGGGGVEYNIKQTFFNGKQRYILYTANIFKTHMYTEPYNTPQD